MAETTKNWTTIPKPYPRKMCIEAYNKASWCEYIVAKKGEDEACDSIVEEVRRVLAAPTAKEAVASLEISLDEYGRATVFDVWESEWFRQTSPIQKAKAVRKAFRELAGMEAV